MKLAEKDPNNKKLSSNGDCIEDHSVDLRVNRQNSGLGVEEIREELKVSPYVNTTEFMKKAKQSNTLIDTFLVLAP
jgi:hypothetical protein